MDSSSWTRSSKKRRTSAENLVCGFFGGARYKEREKEAQRAARELFDAFLQMATTSRALISATPCAWAYGQTDAFLREEFGSAKSLQEFHKIKHWLKEYCDGKDQSPIPAFESEKEWREYLGQRLDKDETERLLGGICRYFWSAVTATLENKARLESVNLACQGAVQPAGGSQAHPPTHETKETAIHTNEKQTPADATELSKGVSEGQTVTLLHQQLKRIRRLYREKGWSPSQMRRAADQDLAVAWEWIDRISDIPLRTEFLEISNWDDGDAFIFRQIATLYEYAPHLSKKPSWSTVRDWRKAFRGYVRHKTRDGRTPRP